MSYAKRTKRPPRTMMDRDRDRLLKVTGKYSETFRDHMIISLALGTGLRQMEIRGLNVGDVMNDDGSAKRTIQLRVYARKGYAKGIDPKAQRVHLPDGTYYKLEKYLRTRFLDAGWRPMPTEPLFASRQSKRLSTRRMRELFREWQQRAGFDQLHNFHELRHTAITNTYRETRNIRIAQQQARHVDLETTTIYEHASDQEVATAVRGLVT